MLTLCIRYTLNPNRTDSFRTYVENEQPVIRKCGGRIAGYYLPTDFAGPTNMAYGLIEFQSLEEYERYRQALADDPVHRSNVADLVASGAVLNMDRSFLRRQAEARSD
jgi:NIPSNAP